MRQENLVLRRWTRNDATPHNIEHRISLLHYLIHDLASVDSQRKDQRVAMYRYNCLQTFKNAYKEINQKSLNESDEECSSDEDEYEEDNDTIHLFRFLFREQICIVGRCIVIKARWCPSKSRSMVWS